MEKQVYESEKTIPNSPDRSTVVLAAWDLLCHGYSVRIVETKKVWHLFYGCPPEMLAKPSVKD